MISHACTAGRGWVGYFASLQTRLAFPGGVFRGFGGSSTTLHCLHAAREWAGSRTAGSMCLLHRGLAACVCCTVAWQGGPALTHLVRRPAAQHPFSLLRVCLAMLPFCWPHVVANKVTIQCVMQLSPPWAILANICDASCNASSTGCIFPCVSANCVVPQGLGLNVWGSGFKV